MITATIAKAKNELSKYLGMVKAGESVLILERNHPVARLCPVNRETIEAQDGANLVKLEATGLIRRPRGRPDWTSLLAEAPAAADGGVSALDALLAEREDSR